MTSMITAAIYTRVSTEEQKDGYSLDAQERACREYIERQGWTVHAHYTDEGFTGRNDQRDGLKALRQDAKAKRFNVVIVHKLDRLARNLELTLGMLREWDKQGVSFVSVSEQMDFSTPIGRVMLANLAAFAQFFSENLSAEIKKGVNEKARQGLWTGELPFGYQKTSRNTIAPSDDAPIVQRMYELYATGQYSYASLAAQLNAEGHRLLYRGERSSFLRDAVNHILQSQTYIGMVPNRGNAYPGQHEPLVSRKLWERCAEIRRERTVESHGAPVAIPGLLAQRSYCGQCDQKLWLSRSGTRDQPRWYYRCSGRTGNTYTACDAPVIRVEMIDQQATGLLCGLTFTSAQRAEIIQRVTNRMTPIAQPIVDPEAIQRQLERLSEVYIDGAMSRQVYETRRQTLRGQLRQAEQTQPTPFDAGAALDTLMSLDRLMAIATLPERQQMIRLIFHRFWAYDDELVAATPTPLYGALLHAARAVVDRGPTSRRPHHVQLVERSWRTIPLWSSYQTPYAG